MSYYLQDNPNPTTPQFGWPRKRVSGAIGVHTAENNTDYEGPDPGAEDVSRFIGRRADYGSYHAIADADSRIKLIHPSYAAWADTTNNAHGMSVSGALQAARWRDLTPDRAQAIVKNMAYAAAELVQDALAAGLLDVPVPARRITATEAINGTRAGFYGHGETNPGTRYDPGQHFDWDLFLATYASAITPEEDDMFDKEAKDQLTMALDDAHRARGVLDSIEEPLHQKLLRVNRWVKGDKDATVYEIDGGRLRGISALEWEILGRPNPAVFPQAKIDAMPKAG